MGKRTVWYRIDHADYPQCENAMVLVSNVPDDIAKRLADDFASELRFVTGLGAEITTWVE